MMPSARQILDALKFVDLPPNPRRKGFTRHECRDELPDVLIELPYNATATDVRTAIFNAGANSQRERTRAAWNQCADTFRSGQHVAAPDDILSLSEPPIIVPQIPA